MLSYVIRRLLLLIPTVLGILLITFALFSLVAKDPARQYAGKKATPEHLADIRHQMGLDKPRLLPNIWEYRETHRIGSLLNTQFFDIMLFRFPESMRYEESVWSLFWRKAPISLAIQLPSFLISLGITLVLALTCAAWRGGKFDLAATVLAVFMMSIPGVSIYLAAQWIFGARLGWFPVAGWDVGFFALHYAALPILVSTFAGLGGGVRFFRTVALEEVNADYVRTGRSKGVSERELLLTHVMRNIMIPVITSTVTTVPLLFMGAIVLEQTFQIPGLGNLLDQAVLNNDRPVVMFIVYVSSIIYCLSLVANDICYTLADPRVKLQ
jgi:peptide/nickel transport system permease protein